VADKVK